MVAMETHAKTADKTPSLLTLQPLAMVVHTLKVTFRVGARGYSCSHTRAHTHAHTQLRNVAAVTADKEEVVNKADGSTAADKPVLITSLICFSASVQIRSS